MLTSCSKAVRHTLGEWASRLSGACKWMCIDGLDRELELQLPFMLHRTWKMKCSYWQLQVRIFSGCIALGTYYTGSPVTSNYTATTTTGSGPTSEQGVQLCLLQSATTTTATTTTATTTTATTFYFFSYDGWENDVRPPLSDLGPQV